MTFKTVGHLHYFLLNQTGISEEEIALMRSHATFEATVVPYIEEIATFLKSHGQNADTIEQNKLLLIGGA